MDDNQFERELVAKGLTAPRITPADIKAAIASEHYFTAADAITPQVGKMVDRFLGWRLPDTFGPDCGISFDGRKDDEWNKNKTWPIGTNLFTAIEAKAMFEHAAAGSQEVPPALGLLTICVLVLQNGFTVLGKSACASPENFDAKIGRDVARADAVSQMWPLLGYALKEELHRRAKFETEPKTGPGRPNPAHGAPNPPGHNPVA